MSEQRNCPREDDLWDLLESATEVDPSLRTHVEACESCTSRLSELRRLHEGLESIGAEQHPPLPESIGPYRIERVLGQGASGTVYEARQQNPERRVALKVSRGTAGADERRLRAFKREIRTLARLEHPSIATIFDAGRAESGEVYFAMQLVEGRPLDEHCDENGLGARDRVRLVATVARAVHYAHQRGVLHRDLKPANILVDREGAPRVLDFGLARPLSTASSLSLTRDSGRVVGTLPYMSPEQARGDEDVDARTDVYSLGLVLYGLLTGRQPYPVPSRLAQAVQAIVDARPEHPSRAQGSIPRELGDVVMKALEKDRDRRYTSIAAFADDLERFLAGEAVSARPASALYSLRVFARTHRAFTAAAVCAALLLAGVSVVVSFAWREAARQRDETTVVAELLAQALEGADIRASGQRDLDDMLADVDDRLSRPGLFPRPSVAEALLRTHLGKAYVYREKHAEGLPHLERALALREELLGPAHEESAAVRYEAAYALYTIAASRFAPELHQARELLAYNVDLFRSGRLGPVLPVVSSMRQLATIDLLVDEAGGPRWLEAPVRPLDHFDEALQLVRRLPRSRARAQEESWVLNQCAIFTTSLDEKLRFNSEALEIRDEWLGPDGWDTHHSVGNLAFARAYRAQSLTAEPEDATRAIDVVRRRFETFWAVSGNPWFEPLDGTLLESRVNFAARLLRIQGGAPLALQLLQEALELHDRRVAAGLGPAHRRFPRIVLVEHLAAALEANDRGAEAEALFADVEVELADQEQIGSREYNIALFFLSNAALSRSDATREADLRRRALSASEQSVDGAPAGQRFGVACVLIRTGAVREGIELFEQTVRTGGTPSLFVRLEVAHARHHLGQTPELDELRTLVSESEEALERVDLENQLALNRSFGRVLQSRYVLGLALAQLGDLAAAEEVLREAYARAFINQISLDEQMRCLLAWALAKVIDERYGSERYVEVRELLGHAAELPAYAPSWPWMYAVIAQDLALARLRTGETALPRALLATALPELRRCFGGEHPYVVAASASEQRLEQGLGAQAR